MHSDARLYAARCGAAFVELAAQLLEDGDEQSAQLVVEEGIAVCGDQPSTSVQETLHDLRAVLNLSERFGPENHLHLFGRRISLLAEPSLTGLPELRRVCGLPN